MIIVATFTFCLAVMFPFLLRIVFSDDFNYEMEEYKREQIEEDLSGYKVELKGANFTSTKEEVEIEVDGQAKTYQMTLYTGNEIPRILSFKNCLEDVLANYDFAKYPMRKTWLSLQALNKYRNTEQELVNMQTLPFEERDSEWLKDFEKVTNVRDLFRKSLMDHEYESYCKGLDLYKGMNDNYDDHVSSSIIRQLAVSDPKGELDFIEASYLMEYLIEKESNNKLLDSGLEQQGELPRILTEERKTILQNSNRILDYKFNNRNTYNEASSTCLTVNYMAGQVSQYGLIILLILIAGSSVSQELATGSIKSLIIAPVRRWKIFTAKLLSIITWMIFASVLVSLLSIIGTGFAFGFDKLPPYLYVAGGAVKEMPYVITKVLFDLVQNIPPFFYAFVAFMISCYTKNTGVSVGVSVGLLLCHQVPTILAESEMPPRILDFTPVANMDITQKLFPYINLMVIDEDFSLFGNSFFSNPLWQCVLYTVVLTLVILFIAFDQFTRKDIA